jgi:5-methylcytosine-specific restriction endonuclease McrA
MAERICVQCGEPITAEGRRKFCTRACYLANNRVAGRERQRALLRVVEHPCEACGVPVMGKHRKWCEECAHGRVEPWKLRRRLGLPDVQHGVCIGCGQAFTWMIRKGQQPRYCTELCSNRTRRDRRRAHEKGGYVEDVPRLEIFERDRWICQLCGRKINRRLKHGHPMAAVIDHIVPLADGGLHERRNCQAAHAWCNSSKGAGAANDQLRLIG